MTLLFSSISARLSRTLMICTLQLVQEKGVYWEVSHTILDRGDAEVFMMDKSVLVETKEGKVGFGGVSSSSSFVGAFDVLVL